MPRSLIYSMSAQGVRNTRGVIPGLHGNGPIRLLASACVQCFQLSDIINLVWACRKQLSHQTL